MKIALIGLKLKNEIVKAAGKIKEEDFKEITSIYKDNIWVDDNLIITQNYLDFVDMVNDYDLKLDGVGMYKKDKVA